MLLYGLIGLSSWLLLFRLFPGVPNASPECGGGGGRKREKEARRQEDIARQREETQNIGNQFLAQLVPGSAEYNELQAEISRLVQTVASPADEQSLVREAGQRLVSQQQSRIASGQPATALEARTQAQVGELRRAAAPTLEEQEIFRALRGETPTTPLGRLLGGVTQPSTELAELRAVLRGTPTTTPLGGRLADLLAPSTELAELRAALRGTSTTTPLGAVGTDILRVARESPDLAFTQELSLLQDQINREAAARGVARGGLPLEQLGRAGVELAVRQAGQREDIRRNRLADVMGLLDVERQRATQGLSDAATIANLEQSRGQQQLSDAGSLIQLGQALRNREIGLEEAITNLQAGRESRLTDILVGQTGNATENLLSLLSSQTGQSIADRIAAAEQAAQSRAALGGAIGTSLAVAAAPFTSGASLALIPAAQSIGSGLAGGGSVGGGARPSSPESLLASQRGGQFGGIFPDLVGGLSRRRKNRPGFRDFAASLPSGTSNEEFATALRGGRF